MRITAGYYNLMSGIISGATTKRQVYARIYQVVTTYTPVTVALVMEAIALSVAMFGEGAYCIAEALYAQIVPTYIRSRDHRMFKTGFLRMLQSVNRGRSDVIDEVEKLRLELSIRTKDD